MDHLALLRGNLQFLSWFYEQGGSAFREIKGKIEANEEPYIPRAGYEYEEPPFLAEWLDANDALRLQGQVCLSLLQRSLREYLDNAVGRHPSSRPNRKGNWFENYRQWFLEELGVDWGKSPVPLARIEELTLARNCVEHGSGDVVDRYRLVKQQSAEYHERFPDAVFADEFEAEMWKEMKYPQPVRIELTPAKLETAIDDALTFCGFVEENLPISMQFR